MSSIIFPFAALQQQVQQNIADISLLQADSHVHVNFALLETYTQTEVDLASAVLLKHDALTLNSSTVTTDTATLLGQEIEFNLATPTTSGIMSAADKTKLDGITDTDDQIAFEVPYTPTTPSDWDTVPTEVRGGLDELANVIDGLMTSTHPQANLGGSVGDTTDDTLNLNITNQTFTVNLVTPSTDGAMSATDKTKLDGIEDNATADQTAAEIRTLVGNATNSNVFTDSEKTKLQGIEPSATADQDATEVPFTPTTTSDWDVTPTEVAGSLDELAGRIETVENLPAFTDELVKVSANDTTGGLLFDKIDTTTSEVSITEVNNGGNEILRINVDLSSFEVTGHTHTASEITDFDTEVSNNTDVSNNTSARHDALSLGGVANDTTDDSLDLTGQVLTANLVTPTTDGVMSAADKTKLDSIDTNANDYTHPNHTGEVTSVADGAQTVQPIVISNKSLVTLSPTDELLINSGGTLKKIVGSDIDDQDASEVPFTPNGDISATDTQAAIEEVRNDTDTKLGDKIDVSEKGAANGVATLDGSGQIPAGQLPSYVDDVLEFATIASFPPTGETGKIYVAINNGKTYRWTGSTYTEISASEVLSVNGETGVVVISTGDITEDSNSRFVTDADLTTLSNTSNTNTGDQDASEVSYNNTTSGLTATDVQAAIDELDSNQDTLQTNSHVAATLNSGATTQESANLVGQELELVKATASTDGVMSSEDKDKLDNIDANANNYVHPNHTGEVTSISDGVQTLDSTAITNKATVTAVSGDYILISDASDGGALKKIDASDVLGGGGLETKAGSVLVGTFAGSPIKTATVTFSTAFADINYAITISPCMTDGSKNFVVTHFNKTTTGFEISLNSSSINDLVSVDWIATKHGES